LNWNVPINKLPFLNWLTVTAKYSGNYDWVASPPLADSLFLGNTISNSNNKQINANVNMVSLYNKIPLFKEVLNPPKNQKKKKSNKREDDEEEPDAKGPQDSEELEEQGLGKKNNKTAKDSTKKKLSEYPLVQGVARLLMMVRTGSFSYTETNGTALPGYLPTSQYLGMRRDETTGNALAPGWPFVAGFQNDQFIYQADSNGWISSNPQLNTPFSMTHSENLNARINLEPFKDFKIEK
jgi:cell surface protein SprA